MSQAEEKTPSFSVENLSVSYGTRPVLANLSFTAHSGLLTGLLGANGSGKTTLLKAVCGQLPHKGRCILHEGQLEPLSGRELSKRISYIPQRSGIHLSMSVLDVVLMGYHPVLKLLEQPSKAMKAAAVKALATVGMEKHFHEDYLTLSEGEKQLCILARTLIEDTGLLLLDEPDSALDFHNRRHMLHVLEDLVRRYKKTAILCLHDPGLALDFCGQLILLKEGEISAVLHPKTDPLPVMEQAFEQIYGPLSLHRLTDSSGRSRLLLLSEFS